MAEPAKVSVADLADGAADLQLTSAGRPVFPLAQVDLASLGASAATVTTARKAAQTSSRVLVGVCAGPLPVSYTELLPALAVTLSTAAHRPELVACELGTALAALEQSVATSPQAAVTLMGLLRLTTQTDVHAGLIAESLAYSMLLAGPEFAGWRAATPRHPVPTVERPVLLDREDDVLHVVLNRPSRHNAFSWQLRDALAEALDVAMHDPTVARLVLRGNGPSFCSGGDLDEFGTTPDPVTAHLVRSTRNIGRLVHQATDRIEALVHGACVGAGIEVPAFAARVEARAGAWFQLPELRMGLVPGAGGTVSLPRRIGRWRTAWMALSGLPIDLPTALTWGLVDARVER